MHAPRILDEEGHPIVGELLAAIRDRERQLDRTRFRQALRRLGAILAYEIARELPCRELEVHTPLGRRREPVLERAPVIVAILRASLPLWEGMLESLPEADSIFIGAARREGGLERDRLSMQVDLSYSSFVPLAGRTLIYCDPMIATGSTLRAIHPLVLEQGGSPAGVWVAGAIAYRGALGLLADALDARLVCASADDELDERGYIVPGLGDAGDLCFGSKLSGTDQDRAGAR